MGFTYDFKMTALEGWQFRDDKGIIMPWYTQPVLKILDAMDFKDKRIFEYGVGHSTVWFRSRGATCFGVDSEKTWANLAQSFYTKNKEEYLNWISMMVDYKFRYDIICIDGDYRDECLSPALKMINHHVGGIIIIDNFEQPSVQADWPKTRAYIDTLPEDGFKIYKQEGHPDWQTLIIYA